MEKKMSPMLYVGLGLNAIGFALVYVFSGMEHNWIPIPIFIIGSALLVAYLAKSRKN